MPATEARRDPLSGRWTLVATDGAPEITPVVASRALEPPTVGEGDPPWRFLATEPVLDRRAVPDRRRLNDGLFTAATNAGRHERIVESTAADDALELCDVERVTETLILYRERMTVMADDNRSRQLGVVKNHGAAAGATMGGSTSEVFALPFVPDDARQALNAFSGHHRRTGTCVLCDMIRFERTEKSRVLEEGLRHIAFLPWASARPYQIVVAPKGHHPSYLVASDADLADAAGLLRRTLLRLRSALGGADYRYTLMTAPLDAGADSGHFHWHIVLFPIVVAPSALDGLMPYNPVPPEAATAALLAGDDG